MNWEQNRGKRRTRMRTEHLVAICRESICEHEWEYHRKAKEFEGGRKDLTNRKTEQLANGIVLDRGERICVYI